MSASCCDGGAPTTRGAGVRDSDVVEVRVGVALAVVVAEAV